jgi:hypothetical protein
MGNVYQVYNTYRHRRAAFNAKRVVEEKIYRVEVVITANDMPPKESPRKGS